MRRPDVEVQSDLLDQINANRRGRNKRAFRDFREWDNFADLARAYRDDPDPDERARVFAELRRLDGELKGVQMNTIPTSIRQLVDPKYREPSPPQPQPEPEVDTW